MRKCVICGKEMCEGCLHEEISAEEYSELYAAGICFWTSWEEDDVC